MTFSQIPEFRLLGKVGFMIIFDSIAILNRNKNSKFLIFIPKTGLKVQKN